LLYLIAKKRAINLAEKSSTILWPPNLADHKKKRNKSKADNVARWLPVWSVEPFPIRT